MRYVDDAAGCAGQQTLSLLRTPPASCAHAQALRCNGAQHEGVVASMMRAHNTHTLPASLPACERSLQWR
jgi:hypothetical protein